MNGILNIFKPKGISSFQAVKEVKNIFNNSKVGHAGTLDPSASGILLVCIGQATKIVEFLIDLKKCYQGEMNLGISTDSQDLEGNIIQIKKVKNNIDEERIKRIFLKYKNIDSQIPPMFSATHYKGERLYRLARKGIEVKRSPKKIKIYKLNLLNFNQNKNHPIIKFEVVCSKGTYIRTLCNDIGNELGCGAYLSNLVRKKIGHFNLKDSISLDALKKEKILENKYLISIDYALKGFKNNITISNEAIQIVLNGGSISNEQIITNTKKSKIEESKFIKIYDLKNNLLSIGIPIKINKNDLIFKPIKVFRNL